MMVSNDGIHQNPNHGYPRWQSKRQSSTSAHRKSHTRISTHTFRTCPIRRFRANTSQSKRVRVNARVRSHTSHQRVRANSSQSKHTSQIDRAKANTEPTHTCQSPTRTRQSKTAHTEDQIPSSPADTYCKRDSTYPNTVRDPAGPRSTRNLDPGGSVPH